MPRRAAVARAVQAHPPRNGGTAAPPRAGRTRTTGLAGRRPANNQRGQKRPVPGPNPAAQGAGAPATPAAPAPTPWDVSYASTENAANTRYGNQVQDLNARRVATNQAYGVAPGYNDFDANPYSRAALLRQSYDQSVRGTRNAAGYQLYSGAYENAQRFNTSNFNQASDVLGREYREDMTEIDREELGAGEQRDRDIEEAGWRRLEHAEEAPPPSPGAPKNKKNKNRDGNRKGGGNRNRGGVSGRRRAR